MNLVSERQPHESGPAAECPTVLDRPTVSVGIVGGSGYTGALLGELVLRHPHTALAAISSERSHGTAVAGMLPRLRCDAVFCREADVEGVDVAFICTPHGQAARAAKRLLDDGALVIDLSADFRLTADAYAEWYGEHPHPEMLPGVYGLTELHRAEITAARLVANPGCYPTAALLALTPLRSFGLSDVIIDAKSGVSGAGKGPGARTHFCAVDSDLVAYAVGGHRHYPEIAAGLAGGDLASTPDLTFMPHLVPLQRGISESIYVRAARLPSAASLRAYFADFYAGERFVEVCEAPPELKDVAGTNVCRIFPTVDDRAGRIVVVAAIDNLMKGACGQALQNMNVMLGLPEHEGLV